jgi:molybdenum cofactor biosynthesis protein MoaC
LTILSIISSGKKLPYFKQLFTQPFAYHIITSQPSISSAIRLFNTSRVHGIDESNNNNNSNQNDKVSTSPHLTHIDPTSGRAAMVDVSEKAITKRMARASASVHLGDAAYHLVVDNTKNAKGDVLAVAQLAGIQAAKRTADLIPLCHPLQLSHVSVDLQLVSEHRRVDIVASVTCTGKTGVEMEALTAASVAALTVFDMCKAADKSILIDSIRVIEKIGGKSGHYYQAISKEKIQ